MPILKRSLAQRYLTEHVEIRCKPRTVEACRWLVKKFVVPGLRTMAIDAVNRELFAALHHIPDQSGIG